MVTDLIPNLLKILALCASTVRALINNSLVMAGALKPSATCNAILRSRSVNNANLTKAVVAVLTDRHRRYIAYNLGSLSLS